MEQTILNINPASELDENSKILLDLLSEIFISHIITTLKNSSDEEFDNIYKEAIEKLGNLEYIYQKATTFQKQTFINLVFGNELTYNGVSYRTHTLNKLFKHKSAILKEKGLLFYKQSLVNFDKESLGEASNSSIEHFLNFLKSIA